MISCMGSATSEGLNAGVHKPGCNDIHAPLIEGRQPSGNTRAPSICCIGKTSACGKVHSVSCQVVGINQQEASVAKGGSHQKDKKR